MSTPATIPGAAEIRAKLQPLSRQQLGVLAELAEVPFHTLWKIRSGETKDPGIDTCAKFYPHIALVLIGNPKTEAAAGA